MTNVGGLNNVISISRQEVFLHILQVSRSFITPLNHFPIPRYIIVREIYPWPGGSFHFASSVQNLLVYDEIQALFRFIVTDTTT